MSFGSNCFTWKILKRKKLNFFNELQKWLKSQINKKRSPPNFFDEVEKFQKKINLGNLLFLEKFKKVKKKKNINFLIKLENGLNHKSYIIIK